MTRFGLGPGKGWALLHTAWGSETDHIPNAKSATDGFVLRPQMFSC